MVKVVKVTLTDLVKKHPVIPAYKGFYSLTKHIYQEDGEKLSESFVLRKRL